LRCCWHLQDVTSVKRHHKEKRNRIKAIENG
jgi:hypothetical protein